MNIGRQPKAAMYEQQRYGVDLHEVISEVFDGEAVVIQMRTGAYYSFPIAATKLWEALLGGIELAEVTVSDDVSLPEVLEWLEAEELVTFDPALRESPSPSEPGDGPAGITKFTDMAEMLIADPIHDIDYGGDGLTTRSDS
jgi:hypothetical protein